MFIVRTFYYCPPGNYMVDESGQAIFNIHRYVSPNELMIFKETEEEMTVRSPKGEWIKLIYWYRPF